MIRPRYKLGPIDERGITTTTTIITTIMRRMLDHLLGRIIPKNIITTATYQCTTVMVMTKKIQ
jgi:hypothetical protein